MRIYLLSYIYTLYKAVMAWLYQPGAPPASGKATSPSPLPDPLPLADLEPTTTIPTLGTHQEAAAMAQKWDALEKEFSPEDLELALLGPHEQGAPHFHLKAVHHPECPRGPCECSPGMVPLDLPCRCQFPQDVMIPTQLPGGPYVAEAPGPTAADRPLHLASIQKAMTRMSKETATKKRLWNETHFDLCAAIYFEAKQAARVAGQELVPFLTTRPVTFLALLPFLQNLPKGHPHQVPRLDQGNPAPSALPSLNDYDLGWVTREAQSTPTWTEWAHSPPSTRAWGTEAPGSQGQGTAPPTLKRQPSRRGKTPLPRGQKNGRTLRPDSPPRSEEVHSSEDGWWDSWEDQQWRSPQPTRGRGLTRGSRHGRPLKGKNQKKGGRRQE